MEGPERIYCVDVSPDMPGGCILWGLYHGEWHPNVSARWVLSKLLNGAGKMLQNETCGGDGWWDGWKQIRDVVAVQSPEGK